MGFETRTELNARNDDNKMNISMSSLVSDAKELVMRLKEREKNVDQVVIQSNALAKKVDAIQQLENELLNLNEKANHRSKVAVLSSIQKENKVIKLLQQENEDLKESLEEHQSVLELIMTKYRQQMLQLILLKKQQEISEQYHYANLVKSLQEKTDKIAEMSEVMRTAVELDEKQVNEQEELIQSLLVENRGLKELLRIRTRYGVKDESSNSTNNQTTNPTTSAIQEATSPTRVDQEVQTDPIEQLDTSSSLLSATALQVSPARPPQPAVQHQTSSETAEVSSPFKLDPSSVSPSSGGKKSLSPPSSSPAQAQETTQVSSAESKDASSPPRLSASPAKPSPSPPKSLPQSPANQSTSERPPTTTATTSPPKETPTPQTTVSPSKTAAPELSTSNVADAELTSSPEIKQENTSPAKPEVAE